MKCPVCKDTSLSIADRQGIEIDYCPQCRGVWLDRGELDKIIERSTSDQGPAMSGKSSRDQDKDYRYDKKKKKKSLLSELLDF